MKNPFQYILFAVTIASCRGTAVEVKPPDKAFYRDQIIGCWDIIENTELQCGSCLFDDNPEILAGTYIKRHCIHKIPGTETYIDTFYVSRKNSVGYSSFWAFSNVGTISYDDNNNIIQSGYRTILSIGQANRPGCSWYKNEFYFKGDTLIGDFYSSVCSNRLAFRHKFIKK